jgi:hypothetical protein
MEEKLKKNVVMAFKEWSLICDALADGSQSLIFRKGGIAEGRGGFSFDHHRFWFFPTQFHTQKNQVLPVAANSDHSRFREHSLQPGEGFELDLMGEITLKGILDAWWKVEQLRSFHHWQDAVLKERFEYGTPKGIQFALVRVYRADSPLQLIMERSFGGCRSWIQLPESSNTARSFTPVLSDDEFCRLRGHLETVLQ